MMLCRAVQTKLFSCAAMPDQPCCASLHPGRGRSGTFRESTAGAAALRVVFDRHSVDIRRNRIPRVFAACDARVLVRAGTRSPVSICGSRKKGQMVVVMREADVHTRVNK